MKREGSHIPLAEAVDRSGFPFQLAIEREIRRTSGKHSWEVAGIEVPLADSYADLVLQRAGFLAVLECKRVQDETWIFMVSKGASENETCCRVEWHNPRAKPHPYVPSLMLSKVFTADCTMCEGSYESSVAVLPKDKAAHSLEKLCGELLAQTHFLGDTGGIEFGDGVTYLVPIIVTNASLTVCEYELDSLDAIAGRLGGAEFKSADFLRFRKTLVSRSGNDYGNLNLMVSDWTADRHRTVFIATPSGLNRLLSGFRAFRLATGESHPAEYLRPPEP